MTKPMTDERREYLTQFIKRTLDELPSGDANANHWAWTAQELLEENERLKENQGAGWDSAIEHHEAEISTYKDENAKLLKVVEAAWDYVADADCYPKLKDALFALHKEKR